MIRASDLGVAARLNLPVQVGLASTYIEAAIEYLGHCPFWFGTKIEVVLSPDSVCELTCAYIAPARPGAALRLAHEYGLKAARLAYAKL